MNNFVRDFADGDMSQADLLGGKGANLAEMTRLGLPVPPGFTITTEACRALPPRDGLPPALDHEVAAHLRRLEQPWADGSATRLTRCWCRSAPGAKFSMPGMMETVLDVGLNDAVGPRAGRATATSASPRTPTAASSRCSAAPCWASTATPSSDALAGSRRRGHRGRHGADDDDLRELVGDFKAIVRRARGRDFPQDPREQLDLAVRAVFDSWNTDARAALPPARGHPRRPRHGRERPGDGLRQPRARLRLRRLLHPGSGHRQPGRVRRLPAERPGRGRRRRHPQHRAADRPRRARPVAYDELLGT